MNKVVVTVVGIQRDRMGEENRIELVTVGNHYNKNGADFITYKESEISGLEGTTTVLKLFDGQVNLIRMGRIEQKQQFRLGETNKSMYVTPFGTMDMEVTTTSMTVAFTGSTGTVNIGYELALDGQWQSTNTLLITIREEQ